MTREEEWAKAAEKVAQDKMNAMRDDFAKAAMPVIFKEVWCRDMTVQQNANVLANWSYAIADAMLAERAKK